MRVMFVVYLLLCLTPAAILGQTPDPQSDNTLAFPEKLAAKLSDRAFRLQSQFTREANRSLSKIARREERMYRKLYGVDSSAAKGLFETSRKEYTAWQQRLLSVPAEGFRSYTGMYLSNLDSLRGSIAFLDQNPQLVSKATAVLPPALQAQLQNAKDRMQLLESRLADADQLKAYLQQRKQAIGQYLAQHADLQGLLGRSYAGLNKDLYYYSQELRQYKEMWNNPDELVQKALTLLNRLPAFQEFMKKNSFLAGLLSVPSNYGTSQGLSGLQTRDQVSQMIQNQVAAGGAGGPAALQSGLQSAESQLDTYKSKLNQLGAGNGDMDMPGFKPNDQKTKTFWNRLELGTNFQTSRNNYYFPTVTDFGLSIGYKLGHDNIVGIGASYKLGWGNGIQHISFTSEGVGLRSFLQVKIKGSFSATGGFEYNYTTPFISYQQLKQLRDWTKSGLIGVTKTVSMKSRVFKKTSVSLLWDLLSYQQLPQTQPIIFRLGYNF